IRLFSKRTMDHRARMRASPALRFVACPPSSVLRIKRPANCRPDGEILKQKNRGPVRPRPGGLGAEESGRRSQPGPEATRVGWAGWLAGQLGACLSEIGRIYETANERVIRFVQNAAADCTNFNCRFFAQILRAEPKPGERRKARRQLRLQVAALARACGSTFPARS